MRLPIQINRYVNMSRKRQAVWDELEAKMSAKRTKNDAMSNKRSKNGSAPHEIVVQKLSSEPDSKQTFKTIQPREFLPFEHEEFTLANLKAACATHFNMPIGTCDVLVSNKGRRHAPHISQIPHRKDKVITVMHIFEYNCIYIHMVHICIGQAIHETILLYKNIKHYVKNVYVF